MVSGNTVKPLYIIAAFFIICAVLVFFLPQIARMQTTDGMQVNVTALTGAGALSEVALEKPLPLADLPAARNGSDNAAYPGLGTFTTSLVNGQANDVVGVYIRDILALPVVQQPADHPDFVGSQHNQLTQFSIPKEYGSIGMLAHNYLSGSRFSQLTPDMEVVLVFGNGFIRRYKVTRVEKFQALNPTSPYSEFIDLANPSLPKLSSADLFRREYTTRGQLVFQTCIEAEDEPSWGRLFVIATPIDPVQLSIPVLNAAQNLN